MDNTELSERKKKILRTVVEDYIETAEPVGSKTVAGEMEVSSATVRNEMAELEGLGLLEQPHTSAGRIPTAQGYRLYVNELMNRHRLSLEETEEINRSMKSRLTQLDKLLADAGQLASRLTDYPAYSLCAAPETATIVRYDLIYVDANTFIIVVMLSNSTVKNKLVTLPAKIEQETLQKLSTVFNASFTKITEDKITPSLISSTERALGDKLGLVAVAAGFAIETLMEAQRTQAYVSGASHLLLHPEYRDVGKAQRLMDYLSDGTELLKLPAPEGESVKITIGPENLREELQDSSVVVAKYDVGDNMQGLIGVVGPTRMDYSKVAAKLSYIAGSLGRIISGDNPRQLTDNNKET